jgi:hypothetical protein
LAELVTLETSSTAQSPIVNVREESSKNISKRASS